MVVIYMALAEIACKALKSEIQGLMIDGKLLGFRVKSYNVRTDDYAYYDFDIEIVKNTPELYEFFKDISKSLKTSKLHRSNGMLYTKEEMQGKYIARELVSKEDTVSVLRPVILLYKRGYLSV